MSSSSSSEDESSSGSSSSSSSSEDETPVRKNVNTKRKLPDARKKEEVKLEGPIKKAKKQSPPKQLSPPVEPSTSKQAISKKKESKTKTPPKQDSKVAKVRKNTDASDTLDDNELLSGMHCILEMSNDDLEEFLQRVDKQCPIDDPKQIKARESLIDWEQVSFSNYEPHQCRRAWGYLQKHARKFRIMHEIVEEMRYSIKADLKRFMKKMIESAPDFPKQPYTSGGFQSYCKEQWDKHKESKGKLNQKADNFLSFQKKCHQDWRNLPDDMKEEYNEQSKFTLFEFRQKVKEYYAKFPTFAPYEKTKPGTTGRPPGPGKVVSEQCKRRMVKISEETHTDAPKIPSTPLQLFMNSKINRLDPPPTPDEIPELKAHYMNKWKKLSNGKRLKWIKDCVNKCEKYLEEIKEYKETHPLFMLTKELKISKLLSVDEYVIWAEAHGCPPKPKNTTFDLFLEDFLSKNDVSGKSETEIHNLAHSAWDKLDWYNKEMFKINLKTQQAAFKKGFEDYYSSLSPLMRTVAVGRLPKKYKKQFMEGLDKESGADSEEDGEGERNEPPRKKKKSKKDTEDCNAADSMESQVETADDEDDGGSPKKRKKRKKKKKVGGEDEDANEIPLYAGNLSLDNLKLIEKHKQEETKRVNLKEDKREKEAGKRVNPKEEKRKKEETRTVNLKEDNVVKRSMTNNNKSSDTTGKINRKNKRKRN